MVAKSEETILSYLFVCLFVRSIPVVWRAESAWTGGLSPALTGKRCSGARTASPSGSEPTPWADFPAVSSSRCSPSWTTDPRGRRRCPRRQSRSPTASSNLRTREEKRHREKPRQKNMYPLMSGRLPAALPQPFAQTQAVWEAADVSEASCQVQPCDSYMEEGRRRRDEGGGGGDVTKAALMLCWL